MTDIGTAYISDGAIIAWLEQKQTEQYTQIGGMMNTSNEETDLQGSLTKLQRDINEEKLSPADLLDEMQSIQQKYSNTDLGSAVDALLLPMEAKVAPLVSSDPNSAAITQTQSAIDASSLPQSAKDVLNLPNQLAQNANDPGQVPVPNGTIMAYAGDWNASIQNEVDKLGHVSQLDLIKINELVADSQQTMQLGSNLISARDQASNTLIANIGRV